MSTKKTKPAAAEASAGSTTEPTAAETPAKAARAARSRKAPKPAKDPGKAAKPRAKPARRERGAKGERKARTNTKQAQLIAMLRAKDGVTVEEAAKAFGWQPHTVRGAIYGALQKKLGLGIDSAKEEGRGRVYRIGS